MAQEQILSRVDFKEIVKDYYPKGIRYGIGCAWLGRDCENRQSVSDNVHTLQTAYSLGLRYYDTAPAYAASEKVVGEFVQSVERNSIFLATKTRLPHPTTPSEVRDHLLRSLDESLKRLKTQFLDLYFLHDIEALDHVLTQGGVVELMTRLKQQGIIRFCGVATRSHALLEQAARDSAVDVIQTYYDYTLLNRSAETLIQKADALNVGLVNAGPFYGLAAHGLELSDETVLAAAVQFPLRNPKINITLTGPANVRELQASYQALSRAVDWSKWDDYAK
jgi:aryl-alcohol dehydrogenase-like predicted oxidoreductase